MQTSVAITQKQAALVEAAIKAVNKASSDFELIVAALDVEGRVTGVDTDSSTLHLEVPDITPEDERKEA